MNVKMPDFNVKKLVKEAGSTLSRVVQVTEREQSGKLFSRVGLSWWLVCFSSRAKNNSWRKRNWAPLRRQNLIHILRICTRGQNAQKYGRRSWWEIPRLSSFPILAIALRISSLRRSRRRSPIVWVIWSTSALTWLKWVCDGEFSTQKKNLPPGSNDAKSLWNKINAFQAGGEFGQDGAYGSTLIKVGQAEQKLGQCERDFIGSAGMCYTQPLKKFLEGEMKTIIKEKGILETKRLAN